MIMTRGRAGQAVLSFAHQVSLSVLATLAATVVVTALKSEWAARPAAPQLAADQPAAQALPSLTQGGKFSARALVGDDPQPFVVLTTLPPVLPLFTAPMVPPLSFAEAMPELSGPATPDVSDVGSTVPPVVARSVRPRPAAPVPPRRHDSAVIAMAPLPAPAAIAPDDEAPSLWSRSKAAYRQVAAWSDALVDIVVP